MPLYSELHVSRSFTGEIRHFNDFYGHDLNDYSFDFNSFTGTRDKYKPG